MDSPPVEAAESLSRARWSIYEGLSEVDDAATALAGLARGGAVAQEVIRAAEVLLDATRALGEDVDALGAELLKSKERGEHLGAGAWIRKGARR